MGERRINGQGSVHSGEILTHGLDPCEGVRSLECRWGYFIVLAVMAGLAA